MSEVLQLSWLDKAVSLCDQKYIIFGKITCTGMYSWYDVVSVSGDSHLSTATEIAPEHCGLLVRSKVTQLLVLSWKSDHWYCLALELRC